jgi:hypothetical protein
MIDGWNVVMKKLGRLLAPGELQARPSLTPGLLAARNKREVVRRREAGGLQRTH